MLHTGLYYEVIWCYYTLWNHVYWRSSDLSPDNWWKLWPIKNPEAVRRWLPTGATGAVVGLWKEFLKSWQQFLHIAVGCHLFFFNQVNHNCLFSLTLPFNSLSIFLLCSPLPLSITFFSLDFFFQASWHIMHLCGRHASLNMCLWWFNISMAVILMHAAVQMSFNRL